MSLKTANAYSVLPGLPGGELVSTHSIIQPGDVTRLTVPTPSEMQLHEMLHAKVDLPKARENFFRRCSEVWETRPSHPSADDHTRSRERAHKQLLALINYAVETNPSATKDVYNGLHDLMLAIDADRDQTTVCGGNPYNKATIPHKRGRPEAHKQDSWLRGAAAACVTILMEDCGYLENDANGFIARKLGQYDGQRVRAATIADWRTKTMNAIGKSKATNEASRVYLAVREEWNEQRASQSAKDFVAAKVLKYSAHFHATLPPRA